ncbi:hypothetical protein BTEBP_40056 [Brochothrix thermosphacta]|nr:hypothetical protein BTEBP_40056 [Brochothrix thermosphacta]
MVSSGIKEKENLVRELPYKKNKQHKYEIGLQLKLATQKN